jgi:hypothetical protein
VDGERFFGGQHGFWAGKKRNRGKHRTEVTEVTEGELRLDGERFFGGQLRFLAEKERRDSCQALLRMKESDPLRVREELLAFHGTGGEACHDPVLEDHDQDNQWDCHHHGSCHDGAPGLLIRCCTAKL